MKLFNKESKKNKDKEPRSLPMGKKSKRIVVCGQ